jgi:hypothetical protein
MNRLIPGLTTLMLAGSAARAQGLSELESRKAEWRRKAEIGLTVVPFPPTKVIEPGQPFPPAEKRVRFGAGGRVIMEGVDTLTLPPGVRKPVPKPWRGRLNRNLGNRRTPPAPSR